MTSCEKQKIAENNIGNIRIITFFIPGFLMDSESAVKNTSQNPALKFLRFY
jgi:hypothetical protein